MNSSNLTTSAPSRAEIELRAFQIWCEQGCPHGRDVENWLEAERQLSERSSGRVSTAEIPRSEDVPAGSTDRLAEDAASLNAPSGVEQRSELAARVNQELIDPGRPQARRSKTNVEL